VVANNVKYLGGEGVVVIFNHFLFFFNLGAWSNAATKCFLEKAFLIHKWSKYQFLGNIFLFSRLQEFYKSLRDTTKLSLPRIGTPESNTDIIFGQKVCVLGPYYKSKLELKSNSSKILPVNYKRICVHIFPFLC